MIRIGRLRIDAGTLSPAEGARLAELVAAALGRAAVAAGPGQAGPRPASLRVAVAPAAGQSLAQAAEGIAAAVMRAMEEAG
jgi:hypothetical protein